MQQKRQILMNPGPVNVTERVRRALLGPDLCHREPEFSALLSGIRRRLVKIFGISKSHTAAVFSGSGTAALEAMLCSAASRNKKTLVLSNGVYGERIKAILQIHSVPVVFLGARIGDFPKLKTIERFLKKDTSIEAVAMVHHETSTGMLNPLEPVGKLAKKYGRLFLVDAVSSLGAESVDFRKCGIDFCAGTAGKCLHGFPGISFVLLSKKARTHLKKKKPRSLYLDVSHTLKFEEKNETPFTPAVQLLYAFQEALKELEGQGLKNRIRGYAEKSRRLERGFTDLGLTFLVQKERRSHVLTALWRPRHISYPKLHDALKKRGFVIYAGQSKLQGRIFRISNLGDMSLKDIGRFLKALKNVLR